MNTAELVRAYEQDPSDDFVVKREAAMVAVAAKIASSTTVEELFGFAESVTAGLAKTTLSGALREICIGELVLASPSFVADGRDTEIFVCALGASSKVVANVKPTEHGRSPREIFSAAVHSGLSFLPASSNAKMDQSVKEILQLSGDAFRITSDASRVRGTVPELEVILDETEQAPEAVAKVVAAVKPLIATLQRNAALDREELELLWFCLGDYSAVLKAKLSTSKASVGLVAAALETTKLLRRLPSSSHVSVALRNVAYEKAKTLEKLVSEAKANRQQFSDYLADNIASAHPSIVPVLSSVLGHSNAAETGALEMADWGRRLILELGLTKFKHLGVV